MQKLTFVSSRENRFDLADLWRQLAAGQLFISSTYCAAGRCFAEVESRTDANRVALPLLNKLELFLLGTSQKYLALDFEVSGATIASQCATVLNAMVSEHTVSRAPILLVMAAHAAQGMPLEFARIEADLEGSRRLISCAIPVASLADRLSRCELEVATSLIQGKKHCEIAQERKTSVRTTANQLASIFAKLGVSGRNELRSKAIHEASSLFAARRAIAPAPVQTLERRPPTLVGCRVLTDIAV